MSLRLEPRFSVYQFSIRLRDYQPTIWRRVQVKDCLLLELHAIILAAFGFEGEHSFRFSRELPDYFGTDRRPRRLPPETWLSQLVPLDGSELLLRHRFGDVNIWRFGLVYEGCVLSAYNTQYPLCLDGERADVPRGMLPLDFDGFLAAKADDVARGASGPARSDPAHFNLAAVNSRLGRLSQNTTPPERECENTLRVGGN